VSVPVLVPLAVVVVGALGALVGRPLGTRVAVEAAVVSGVVAGLVTLLPLPWGLLVLGLGLVVLVFGLPIVVMRRAVDATIEGLAPEQVDPAVAEAVRAVTWTGCRPVVTLRYSPRGLAPTDLVLLWWEGWPVVAVVHGVRGTGQVRTALRSAFGAEGWLSTTSSVMAGAPSTVVWSLPEAGPGDLVEAHRRALEWAGAQGLQPHPVGPADLEPMYRRGEQQDAEHIRGMGLWGLATFGQRSRAPRVPPWEQPDAARRLTG
jgi:hypothetical protein